MIYLFCFLLGLFVLFVLSLVAGPTFSAGRNKSAQRIQLQYLRLLDELRQVPTNSALREETRSTGYRFVSFSLESRGIEPSKSDYEEIDLEIDDAIQGHGFHSHVSRARPKPRRVSLMGCLITLVLIYVCLVVSVKLGKHFVDWTSKTQQKPTQSKVSEDDQSSAFNN